MDPASTCDYRKVKLHARAPLLAIWHILVSVLALASRDTRG